MARPTMTERTVYKNIALPESLAGRLDLELFSEVEGRVPFGAYKEFFTGLIERHFSATDAARKAQEALLAEGNRLLAAEQST